MPDKVSLSETGASTDPSVVKQIDRDTPKEQQAKDFFAIADGLKLCLMITERANIGPVSRAMAVAKREGPDFLFVANVNSQKFKDIKNNSTINLSFIDNKSTDWISVTGKATTRLNKEDPRIEKIYSTAVKAWFGDLGDGVHDGSAKDPRVGSIEVKSNYVAYYKTETGMLGHTKEIAQATLTGQVAQTGLLRELSEEDLDLARRWEK